MFRSYDAFSLTAALFSVTLYAMPAMAGDTKPGVPAEQSGASDHKASAKNGSDDDFFSWIRKAVEPTGDQKERPRTRLHEGGDKDHHGGDRGGHDGGHK